MQWVKIKKQTLFSTLMYDNYAVKSQLFRSVPVIKIFKQEQICTPPEQNKS